MIPAPSRPAMNYFIGDIHGYLDKLLSLMNKIEAELEHGDTLVFLGDYIDRGGFSFEVIEYLVSAAKAHNAVFLKGNHEDMLLKYLGGGDVRDIYFVNGGEATMASYIRNCGSFRLPARHMDFMEKLLLYYEGEDFIAVHAGLNPKINNMKEQSERDLLWIRESFFRADMKWEKTVVFGHTPTSLFHRPDSVYIDDKRNIIGVDSGVIYGGPISCLRLPDRAVFQS